MVGAFSERKTLTPADGRADRGARVHQLGASVDPGIYQLRLAAVDSDGRRGSVVHAVNAWQLAGEQFAFGDLFVGNMPESGVTVRPGVEPHVDNGALAAFIELYSTTPATLGKAQVTFEIASDQDGPSLASSPATLVGDGAGTAAGRAGRHRGGGAASGPLCRAREDRVRAASRLAC